MKCIVNATILSITITVFGMLLLLTACGNDGSPIPPIRTSSESALITDMPEKKTHSVVLSGLGNSPSNLLCDGMAVEFNGYIYHIDEMFEGNLWRTPVAGGESELLCKGAFSGLNVNADLIFSLLSFPDPDSDLSSGGICIMNTDGSNARILKEGYFSRLILNDDYLYYSDGNDGALYRMKYDGSNEQLLLGEEVYDSFLVIDGSLYIFSDLDEEYVTNIYKMPLDGSAPPEMIIKDIFGGVGAGRSEIFYSSRDNSSNLYRYDTVTAEKSLFADKWLDYINTDGGFIYYFWSGAKADNSDSGLYRMKPDASEIQLLHQAEELYSLNIAGGKLFWHNNDEQRRLTTASLDCTSVSYVEQAVK